MFKNWTKVKCTKCKGTGIFDGRYVEGKQLRDFRYIDNGVCHTCKGSKFLYKTEEGKYIRIDKNKLLQYNDEGKYLGIWDTVESYFNKINTADDSYFYEERRYSITDFFVVETLIKEAIELLSNGTHPDDKEVMRRILDSYEMESFLLDNFKDGYRSIRFITKHLMDIQSTIMNVNHALLTSNSLNDDITKELLSIKDYALHRQERATRTMQELLNK